MQFTLSYSLTLPIIWSTVTKKMKPRLITITMTCREQRQRTVEASDQSLMTEHHQALRKPKRRIFNNSLEGSSVPGSRLCRSSSRSPSVCRLHLLPLLHKHRHRNKPDVRSIVLCVDPASARLACRAVPSIRARLMDSSTHLASYATDHHQQVRLRHCDHLWPQ